VRLPGGSPAAGRSAWFEFFTLWDTMGHFQESRRRSPGQRGSSNGHTFRQCDTASSRSSNPTMSTMRPFAHREKPASEGPLHHGPRPPVPAHGQADEDRSSRMLTSENLGSDPRLATRSYQARTWSRLRPAGPTAPGAPQVTSGSRSSLKEEESAASRAIRTCPARPSIVSSGCFRHRSPPGAAQKPYPVLTAGFCNGRWWRMRPVVHVAIAEHQDVEGIVVTNPPRVPRSLFWGSVLRALHVAGADS